MMGRLKSDQGQLFYEFRLGDAVPEDHMVRKIDTALESTRCSGRVCSAAGRGHALTGPLCADFVAKVG